MEEVKLAIKPYYQKKDITKEEYKDILRKAVHKVGPGGGLSTDVGRGRGEEVAVCRHTCTRGEPGRGQDPLKPTRAHSTGVRGPCRGVGPEFAGATLIPVCSCAQQSRWRGPWGTGGDRSCLSPRRSATAKAGRSTQ